MTSGSRRDRRHRALAAAAIVVVLATVTASYFAPDMLVSLATRVWACF